MKNIYLLLALVLILIFGQNPSQAQELIFAKKIGSDSPDSFLEQGNSIALDETGNIYVTGTIGSGSTGAIFGEDEINETIININGSFVAKFNNSGELLWVQQMGASNNDITSYAIDVDNNGNVYVSGTFFQEAKFGAGQTNETTLSGTSGEIFIAKYDSDGNLLWAKNSGGDNDDNPGGRGLVVDNAGNVYVTGSFWGTVIFGEGETNETTLVGENTDIFVAKYDTNGTLLWIQKAGGSSFDGGKNIDLDEEGNIFLTGNYFDSAVFGEGLSNETTLNDGNESAFIAKYTNAGNFLWAIEPFNSGTGDISGDIKTDKHGSILFTGSFFGTITLGAGTGNEQQLSGVGLDELIVAKYNSEGEFVWAKTAESTGDDRGVSLVIDTFANVFITGYYGGDIHFGANERNDTTISNLGSSDLYIAKFSSAGEFIWVTSAGGSEWEQGKNIAIDESGNTYVTGFYRSNIIFGKAETNETNLSIDGFNDIFISKFQRSNDTPQINAYNGVTFIQKNETVEITLTDLNITDIDNSFPNDFTLVVFEGENYTVTSNSVTPALDFIGTIDVLILVNDGEFDSEEFMISFEVNEILGLDNSFIEENFTIYPNPASNLLNVISYKETQYQISIFTIKGELVYSSSAKNPEQSIDLTSFKDGIYLLQVISEGKQEVMKLLKN
jgi:hypothetical protein